MRLCIGEVLICNSYETALTCALRVYDKNLNI